MTRTYTNTIGSILSFKQDILSFYSDMHKDHYGCRWVPAYLLEPEHTMEDVLEAMDSLLATIEYERDDTPFVYSPTLFTNRMSF